MSPRVRNHLVPALWMALVPFTAGSQLVERAFFAHAFEPSRVCVPVAGTGLACSDVSVEKTASRGVTVADFNADGLVDLWLANQNGQDRVCMGIAAGGFGCTPAGPATDSFDAVASDFDLDGVLDAFVTGLAGSEVCLGDGAGGFFCSRVSSGGFDAALADVTDDGLADVVIAGGGGRNLLCESDGSGGFTCLPIADYSNSDTWAVAIGDLDRNGYPDFVFGDTGTNAVCLDGTGCQSLSGPSGNTTAVFLGYIDGDDLLDAVFSNFGQRNRVCLGDGLGGLRCSDLSGDADGSQDIALGDVDGDGLLDAVIANEVQENQLCLGFGEGSFSCNDAGPPFESSRAVALELERAPVAPIPTLRLSAVLILTLLLAVAGVSALR